MILREATIKYKGYNPDSLTKGSRKRVCCSCDNCGRIRYIKFNQYKDLCVICSQIGIQSGENNSQYRMSGELSSNFGKRGKETSMYGKHHTIKTRQKMSKDRNGELNGNWKGGIAGNRDHVLSEQACIKLNEKFDNSDFHHITKSLGIYIPKELHRHIGHNLKSGKNMGEMNALAIQFINGGLDI